MMGNRDGDQHDDDGRAAKRRKVRKGTRSCWECQYFVLFPIALYSSSIVKVANDPKVTSPVSHF